jgi:small subunit ribosomal protein S4
VVLEHHSSSTEGGRVGRAVTSGKRLPHAGARPWPAADAQMRRAHEDAHRGKGKTGETMVTLLERRLDATVHRAGLARTIYQARQLVAHGHFTVDGKKVDRPSYRLTPGQVVQVRGSSQEKAPLQIAAVGAHLDGPSAPSTELDELRTTVIREPQRTEIPVICDEHLVVELYAR